jgi:hypothetical protein
MSCKSKILEHENEFKEKMIKEYIYLKLIIEIMFNLNQFKKKIIQVINFQFL